MKYSRNGLWNVPFCSGLGCFVLNYARCDNHSLDPSLCILYITSCLVKWSFTFGTSFRLSIDASLLIELEDLMVPNSNDGNNSVIRETIVEITGTFKRNNFFKAIEFFISPIFIFIQTVMTLCLSGGFHNFLV